VKIQKRGLYKPHKKADILYYGIKAVSSLDVWFHALFVKILLKKRALVLFRPL
jgi:hypothetical protein